MYQPHLALSFPIMTTPTLSSFSFSLFFPSSDSLLDLLICDLFDPNRNVDPAYKDQYIFLLAYASCSDDHRLIVEPCDHTFVYSRPLHMNSIIQSLKTIQEICYDNPFGFELKDLSDKIIDNIKYPMSSMGLLYWIRLNLTEPDLLTSTYNTNSHVTMFGLLREISYMHITQRKEVLDILTKAFNAKINVDPIQEVCRCIRSERIRRDKERNRGEGIIFDQSFLTPIKLLILNLSHHSITLFDNPLTPPFNSLNSHHFLSTPFTYGFLL